ncbi:MAG: hypothetical protein PHD67_09110 [Oscillospiraceae bacterium]|nr:hypothetical protein [Oscillospiraceae bacterium]
MIVFPLDNTDYDAAALGSYMATRTAGVYAADGNFEVTANGDMTVTVSPGLAWALMSDAWGVSMYLDSDYNLTIPTADGVLSRIDSVVLRMDKINNTAYPAVVKGPPGSAPVAPAPQRDAAAYELVIARVSVPAGAVGITQSNITDTRLDETVCGLMRDGVTGIPTAELYAQAAAQMTDWNAEFGAWFAAVQDTLDADTAGHLLSLINQNAAAIEGVIADGTMMHTDRAQLMSSSLTAGGSQDVGTAQVRNVSAGTTDMTAGVSELATGSLYFVYE